MRVAHSHMRHDTLLEAQIERHAIFEPDIPDACGEDMRESVRAGFLRARRERKAREARDAKR